MSNWQIVLFTKWTTVKGSNEMAVAATYPSAGSLGQESGWTDLGQQTDAAIKNRGPNFCTMAMGKVNDAGLASITADTHYLILARREADTGTPSFDNTQSIVTTAQKNAFVTYFQNEFGINVASIPSVANSVGQTRQAVIQAMVVDLRRLT